MINAIILGGSGLFLLALSYISAHLVDKQLAEQERQEQHEH